MLKNKFYAYVVLVNYDNNEKVISVNIGGVKLKCENSSQGELVVLLNEELLNKHENFIRFWIGLLLNKFWLIS